jgi:cell surface protein SprA
LNFFPDASDVSKNLDEEFNWIPEIQFQKADVSIQEQFGPLGKIDMRLKNSILASIEIRKSRTIGLNFGSSTVTEQNSFDVVVGGGYVIKDLVLPIRVQGKKLKSNLDLKLNVAVKSTNLIRMDIIDYISTTTQGSKITNINITADYMLSRQLTIRAFYTQTINNPFIATSYPTSTTSGGLSLRFAL